MLVEIRRLRVAALLLAVSLLAVACGRGSTVNQTSAVELKDPPNASAATLKLTDFPAGWTGEPSEPSEQTKCAVTSETTSVRSQDFSDGVSYISNEIEVYDTVADATKDFALMSDPKFIDCLRNELVALLMEDADPSAKVTASTGAPLAIGQHGQASGGLRFSVSGSASAGEFVLVYDMAVVQVGRMIALLPHFIGDGQPLDDALRNQLIGVSSKRLPANA